MKKLCLLLLLIATLALPDYLVHRITNDPPLAEDDHPTWSPDGTKIAYQTILNGKHEIYYISTSGSGTPVRITNNDGQNQFPSWSPDGNRIAYGSNRSEGVGLWIYYLNTGNEIFVTQGGAPSWAPDSNYIAYHRVSDIFKINLITSEETQLTSGTGQKGWPDWSHDGTKILYILGDFLPTVWYVPSGGGNPQQIQVPYAYGPKWHPDGTKICFSGGSAQGNYVIWVYDLLKNKLTQITPGVEQGPDAWSDANPDWSPDGTKIAFRRLGNIYIVDLTQQQELSTLGKIKAYYR